MSLYKEILPFYCSLCGSITKLDQSALLSIVAISPVTCQRQLVTLVPLKAMRYIDFMHYLSLFKFFVFVNV